ncbi:MAG: hypothetical protein K2X93_25815 [Candidatus Obscuribacterales bacterium]|nr:hypothetical protein [Candidatus Obscuribacterales bacterium]
MMSDYFETCAKAGHPEYKQQILGFALSPDPGVRIRVAENTDVPTDVLELLSIDNAADVRLAVGLNPSTPVDITYMLAYDDDQTVRFGLAEDYHAPLGVLKILSKDDNPYVACRAQKTVEGLIETARRSNGNPSNSSLQCIEHSFSLLNSVAPSIPVAGPY